MVPISVVEGGGFRELINFIQPDYNIPSRAAITSRLEDRYENKKEELKMAQSSVKKIALTMDCWTALTRESYITITCHYIDSEWKMKCAVLLTESLSDKHTADKLAEKLNEAVASWGITGKITARVHDNAKNIVAANDQTRVSWDAVLCPHITTRHKRWLQHILKQGNRSCWKTCSALQSQYCSYPSTS